MSTYQFEQVNVPAGAFMSWGPEPGQIVIGKVLSYDLLGGSDFNGTSCPQIGLELIEPTYAINKAGERYDFQAGELLTLNAGLANLKKAVVKADPKPGDVLKIVYAATEKTVKGSVKLFEIYVARGAGQSVSKPPAASSSSAGASMVAQRPF